MTVILELFEFKNICMSMAELGAAASEKKRSPVSDEIKQREAYRWIKALGYEPSLLDKLEEEGLIHKKRKGTSKNSPLIYSKFEIQSAISALRMSKYVNK
jgi:hypothetical protein